MHWAYAVTLNHTVVPPNICSDQSYDAWLIKAEMNMYIADILWIEHKQGTWTEERAS